MTGSEFLEVSVSLVFQVSLLVIVSNWVTRFTARDADASRVWACCHVLILALTIRAFTLPRFESIQPWTGLTPSTALGIALWQNRLGWLVLSIWSAGAVGSLLLLIVSWFRIHQFLQSCRPLQEAEGVLALQDGFELPPMPGLKLLVSSRLRSPFCWQLHHPLIVFPEFLLDFHDDEKLLILRHELEHLRTGHPLSLFLQRLAEIVFWFHPVVWWSSRQAALTREFACDDAAVTSRRELANYLRSLVKIVEYDAEEPGPQTAALAFGGGKGMMAQRAARLVKKAKCGMMTTAANSRRAGNLTTALLMSAMVISAFVWVPVDLTRSRNASWSRWPTWSAHTLHTFGVAVRDYDFDDHRYSLHELLEEQREFSANSQR